MPSAAQVGHPDYEVTAGSAVYKGQDLLELEPEDRARAGLFMSFQSPVEVRQRFQICMVLRVDTVFPYSGQTPVMLPTQLSTGALEDLVSVHLAFSSTLKSAGHVRHAQVSGVSNIDFLRTARFLTSSAP